MDSEDTFIIKHFINPYPTKAGFFYPSTSYRTKKDILLSALKNEFPIRPFYSKIS